MVSLLETSLEANSHAKAVRESIPRGPFTLPSLRNSIPFSYLSRRVVPSIITPTSKLLGTFDHLINYMILQPRCWVPYSTFVLPCSSWTCEVNALDSPTSCSTASVRLRRIVWISSGLWFYGRSEIESKSSCFWCLSPRRLVASNLCQV